MLKSISVSRGTLFGLLACAFFLIGCSQQPSEQLVGVWRSDDDVAGKNLVIEFVPDGTGKVFSGSIIGVPADGAFEWEMKGDQVTIEPVGDESVAQTMTVLSQSANTLSVEVNRTELSLVRIEGVIDDDAGDLLSEGIDE